MVVERISTVAITNDDDFQCCKIVRFYWLLVINILAEVILLDLKHEVVYDCTVLCNRYHKPTERSVHTCKTIRRLLLLRALLRAQVVENMLGLR
mmetsp:Transcript_10751/g.16151  ORF Transcript_10751/g.16151 Transcript_10751/m.16151 type:complete len:94 (+) Transcript_10751:1727-2008(+)